MRIALAALGVGLVTTIGSGVTANANPTEVSPTITQLAWSPNGKWLAFAEGTQYQALAVSVVRLDRAVQRRVVAVADSSFVYVGGWSPDSMEIAFVQGDYSSGRVVTWISSANGLALRSFDGRFQNWSPDSRSFLLSRAGGLYVVDNRTGTDRFLTQGYNADWSPDGTRIAFSAITARHWCFGGTVQRLFSVAPNGTDRRQLGPDSPGITHQTVAGWAPDSSRLVYYETDRFCNDSSGPRAFMVPADGSRQASEIGHDAGCVAWSPGGGRLGICELFTALRIVTPDGATVATIADATGGFGWGPKGGSVVFSAGDGAGTPGWIWAARADGTGQPRYLGHGTYPTWSTLGWIAFASRGSCAGKGERVKVVRPTGKLRHVLSRCRPTR